MATQTRYYRYGSTTYRIEQDENREERGYLLNLETGVFQRNDDLIDEVTGATTTSYITRTHFDNFVRYSEGVRQRLRGEGPAFALYDTIQAIHDKLQAEGRIQFEPAEAALVQAIHKRTFPLWEEDERRRAEGLPPKNIATGWR
ncbi:hypothetical protein [Actinokineospora enzanensis]|uniref:hypothetical protein n=1 Tax=Actinokineospora enzanensis TaxID=155975 RepID=UPI00036CCD22|nr:hypothetical protein [Actinokineospora enzanensis]